MNSLKVFVRLVVSDTRELIRPVFNNVIARSPERTTKQSVGIHLKLNGLLRRIKLPSVV
jgi:hypothetical protein